MVTSFLRLQHDLLAERQQTAHLTESLVYAKSHKSYSIKVKKAREYCGRAVISNKELTTLSSCRPFNFSCLRFLAGDIVYAKSRDARAGIDAIKYPRRSSL
jgi:hypothetical protein